MCCPCPSLLPYGSLVHQSPDSRTPALQPRPMPNAPSIHLLWSEFAVGLPRCAVVMDNSVAPADFADRLAAALMLLLHVLDALEVPCSLRRCRRSPF